MTQSHAGLWIRIKAFSADYLVISLYITFLVVISLLIQSADASLIQLLFGNPLTGQLSGFVLITLPVTLYFTISESSSHQGTWGKRWQGIKVVRNNGTRLSRRRALVRTALKFIPWELAHTCIWQINTTKEELSSLITAGFIFVWIFVTLYVVTLLKSSKKQTLYDQITNTFVVKN